MADRIEIQQAMNSAEEALSAFEASIGRRDYIRRLQRVSPAHPALLMVKACVMVSIACLVAALGWMSLVALWSDMPTWLAVMADPSATVPAPLALVGVAGLSAIVAASADLAAAASGAVAPMTPEELRVHQRLSSDVYRTRALLDVRDRMVERSYWAV